MAIEYRKRVCLAVACRFCQASLTNEELRKLKSQSATATAKEKDGNKKAKLKKDEKLPKDEKPLKAEKRKKDDGKEKDDIQPKAPKAAKKK